MSNGEVRINLNNYKQVCGLLVELITNYSVFSRNLFSLQQNSKKMKLVEPEIKFLHCLYDYLHNVPELLKHLLSLQDDKKTQENYFLFKLVYENLYDLKNLICDEVYRENFGIKNTELINYWNKVLLVWVKVDVEKLLGYFVIEREKI